MSNKLYLNVDVFTAAVARISWVFDRFERVVVSFSGGKDSTVLLHLVLEEARRRARKVHVLFIDLEGQYQATIDHVREMMALPEVIPLWVALPLNLRNAVSSFEPFWCCWEPGEEANWIRPLPEGPGVITDPGFFPFYQYRMEFEEFVDGFGPWLAEGKPLAQFVGIRADESLNRVRTVMKARESRYEGQPWTCQKGEHAVNIYPIYDWSVEDIWTYVGKTGCSYNTLYNQMWEAGLTPHEMRICQPYGDDQRKGLDLFHLIEPETWYRVVQRVSGANYGALYAGQKILGYRGGLGLPPGLTWKQYTKMLLRSLPAHMEAHYRQKFLTFMLWWKNHRKNYGYTGMFDQGIKNPSTGKNIPSWQRMALCILDHDYLCSSLKFGQVKRQAQKMEALKEKYSSI